MAFFARVVSLKPSLLHKNIRNIIHDKLGFKVYPDKIYSLHNLQKPLLHLAPRDGLEPPTQWLTATKSIVLPSYLYAYNPLQINIFRP
jgi:hypothetical protein